MPVVPAPPPRPAGLELSGPLSADDQEFVGEHLAEGRVFRKYGLGDKARDQFEAILGRFPDNLEALQELADLHREKGESEAAAQRLRVMAEVHRLKGDAALAARLDADAAALAPAPPAVEAPAPAPVPATPALAPPAPTLAGAETGVEITVEEPAPEEETPEDEGLLEELGELEPAPAGPEPHARLDASDFAPEGGGEIGGHFIDEEEAPAADFDLEEAGPDLAPPPLVTTGLVAQAASAGAVAGDLPPDLRRALDEVESYVSMGFVEDAKGVLGEVRSRFASHPALVQRLAELGLGVEPAPPMSAEDLLLAEDAPAPPPAEEPLKFGADFLEFTPTTPSPAPPVEVPEPRPRREEAASTSTPSWATCSGRRRPSPPRRPRSPAPAPTSATPPSPTSSASSRRASTSSSARKTTRPATTSASPTRRWGSSTRPSPSSSSRPRTRAGSSSARACSGSASSRRACRSSRSSGSRRASPRRAAPRRSTRGCATTSRAPSSSRARPTRALALFTELYGQDTTFRDVAEKVRQLGDGR